MNALYQTAGISKQAVAQYAKRQEIFDRKMSDLIVEADELREAHPGCGVEKMYYTLRPDFIGRDRFVEAFMSLGYRLKRQKNYRITTRRGNHYFENLIKGVKVNGPSQIWQSDITYIEADDRFFYAVFIIDVYTKEIVGHQLSDHMRAQANVKALNMALQEHDPPEIHHSDRGSQYIYSGYVDKLKRIGSKLSMGKIAQENAYAERINGTIKNEYIRYWRPESYGQLKRYINKAVKNYNEIRPHDNLGKKSPREFIEEISLMRPHQRKEITIFEYQ
jgi:transposase InsO family protein